jgi:hypothetical protein
MLFPTTIASSRRGISSLSPWRLDVGFEEAEVGRCEAEAICASDRAASVRHLRVGACFSTLRASSGISDQEALQRA